MIFVILGLMAGACLYWGIIRPLLIWASGSPKEDRDIRDQLCNARHSNYRAYTGIYFGEHPQVRR